MPATRNMQTKRTVQVKRVLWIVLFLNLGVALAKYIYGVISGSTSMQADGIHSVFDSAGNVVGLIGISLATKPADRNHPYGHFKFETYASLVIGIFLLVAAAEVGSSAVTSLVNQEFNATVTPISFAVMIITLFINISVSRYESKCGRELNSEILVADSRHTLSDALVSIGVIIGLILIQFGIAMADAIMALIVMVAILLTAFDVFKTGLQTLSDKSRLPEERISEIVSAIPGVRKPHMIRSRGTTDEVYVDLHILVDPNMTVLESHALSDEIEKQINDAFPEAKDILVHVEPDDGLH